jgi:hypothetical protein
VGEGDDEAQRRVAVVAGLIVDAPGGLERHVVVVLDLVGDLGDPGLLDRAHVVIPPVDALLAQAPVGGPAEVGRIDVGGQALLQAVQLVGPDEMHLARQAGLVALEPEVMGEGRDGGAEFRRVVVDAGVRGQQPGHEDRPRRGAQGRGAVSGFKHHAFLGQAVERRGLHDRVAIGLETQSRQLVDHDDEKIRLGSAHVRLNMSVVLTSRGSMRDAARL